VTGEVLPDRILYTSFGCVAWLPDASGFYTNAGRDVDTVDARKRILFHRIGDDRAGEPAALEFRERFVAPQISADGRYVVAVESEVTPRPAYLLDREAGGDWRPFLRDLAGTVIIGVFVADEYVAISTEGAPRGRVVAIPVASPLDHSTWRELVPEGDGVMRGISLVGDKLVLAELLDGSSRIRIFSTDGALEEEVPLPGRGSVKLDGLWWGQMAIDPVIAAGDGEFSFVFSTFTAAPALYRYVVEERRLEELAAPASRLEGATVRHLSCTSSDGAEVRYDVVHRKDLDLSKPRPTLVYGYGGWNIAFVPIYLGRYAPFIDAGGVFVFAYLRGGGEFGIDWWHQGRLARKQRTFDDLYAVAEDMIARGLTTSELLAAAGASNGGLLAGAAAVQRPDLFRVVVSKVPLLDLLRYDRDPMGSLFVIEYGDPRKPEDARVLAAYSPYHNIREGVDYPATLVVCGDQDVHCFPWHGRKFVARLQRATTSERPILLRIWEGYGHIAALVSEPWQTAEWLGFVMSELGMSPPS
jgi:prolyl oligopeptidase